MTMTKQTHHMKLNTGPFMMIARGEKTVELRLYDEKRQKVALGDNIIFTLVDDKTQTLTVRVVGLLRYATFKDMFARNDPKKFGGNSATELTVSLKKYYSEKMQAESGVLGVEFQKL